MKEEKMKFNSFKNLWKRIKQWFTKEEQRVSPAIEPDEPIENRNQLIKSLIHVESMLYQSACTAEDKYSNNAEHLMKIIKNQHLGVESVLKRMGVECKRSHIGDDFSPENMEASENYVLTNDKTLNEKVAISEIPGFWQGDKIIEFEKVRLYKYQA